MRTGIRKGSDQVRDVAVKSLVAVCVVDGFRPIDRKTSLSIRQEKGTWRVVLMGSKDLSATVAARHRRLLCSSYGRATVYETVGRRFNSFHSKQNAKTATVVCEKHLMLEAQVNQAQPMLARCHWFVTEDS